MDILKLTDNDFVNIWRNISNKQLVFHPEISANGRFTIRDFLNWKMHKTTCCVAIDNNILIDIVKICTSGCLPDRQRTSDIALLILWVEMNKMSMTAGLALQEKSQSLSNDMLRYEVGIFKKLWEFYSPQQWFDLYKGYINKLPCIDIYTDINNDISVYTDAPETFLQAYASMIHLVYLLRNIELSTFERIKYFFKWTYEKTLVSKYIVAYAVLRFMNRDGINGPRKAFSADPDTILEGCRNQAWDLCDVNAWNQMLFRENTGEIKETYLFATQDQLLKRIITSTIACDDLCPFLKKVFTEHTEDYNTLMLLVSEWSRRIPRDDVMSKNYLEDLIHQEEKLLRDAILSSRY